MSAELKTDLLRRRRVRIPALVLVLYVASVLSFMVVNLTVADGSFQDLWGDLEAAVVISTVQLPVLAIIVVGATEAIYSV